MQIHQQSTLRRALDGLRPGLTRLGVGYALLGAALVALLSR
jgi:hypothetical protein